jgi:uncharacterized protein with PQ loop repeat
MNIEILGTFASILVLVSFLMKNEKMIRSVNMVGAIVFVIYGVCINAFSVWFFNGVLSLVHAYKLLKIK